MRSGRVIALDPEDLDAPEHERQNPWRVQFVEEGPEKGDTARMYYLNFPRRSLARQALKNWKQGMPLEDIANTLRAYRQTHGGCEC